MKKKSNKELFSEIKLLQAHKKYINR